MNRPGPIARPPDKNPHRGGAVLASCVLHAVLLGILVIVLCRPARTPLATGSAAATPTLTLSKLVIVAAPIPPAPPQKKISLTPAPAPPAPKPLPETMPVVKTPAPAKIPDEGVPLLAAQSKPAKASKPHPSHHAPAPIAAAAPVAVAPASSPISSSYAPGENVFPHPPYPEEARYLRETGTVVVNVRFDTVGRAAQVEVAQSSGIPLLDTQTRTFIRAHWRTEAYAGRMLRVPVQYTLESD